MSVERLEYRLLAAVKIVPAPASYEFVDMGYDTATQSPVIVGYEHNAPNKTPKIFELNAGQTGFDSTTLPGLAQSTFPNAPVYVYGVSSNGYRIGGQSKSVGSTHSGEGTTWLKNAPTTPVGIGWLSGLCANNSYAIGAWHDGVVGACGGGGRAAKWTQATGIVDLGGYVGGAAFASEVSANGAVIVGIATHEVFDGAAYYWDNAGIHRLAYISNTYQSIANTVSPNGDYIGGFASEVDALENDFIHPAVWDANRNLTILKDANNNTFQGRVYGISNSGYAVGRTRDNKGFIWHPSFDGIQSPFNGAQIFDAWLANIPNGQVLPFASKGIEAISEDPVNNRLLFALSDYEAPGASAYVEVELETVAPTVTGVYAAGSTWSAAMIDAVDGGGVGAGNGLGYAIGSGLTLPNAGIDRIYVQFSEPVVGFNASTVAMLGVDVADYESVPGLMSVSYDSANRRGVIQLSSSLVKEKLRLGVSDAVTDLSLNALDGDANASAGGVMNLRFNVLVGDANNDGSVNGGDLPFFATAFNTSTGSTSYNPRVDWNANGSVNGGDLPLFAVRFNQSLPTGEPAALGFPPALLPPLDSESMLAPPIEEIEAFFSQLDEDDELLVFESSDETL